MWLSCGYGVPVNGSDNGFLAGFELFDRIRHQILDISLEDVLGGSEIDAGPRSIKFSRERENSKLLSAQMDCSSSSAPDYYGFLDRMRRPAAADLIRSTKRYLSLSQRKISIFFNLALQNKFLFISILAIFCSWKF